MAHLQQTQKIITAQPKNKANLKSQPNNFHNAGNAEPHFVGNQKLNTTEQFARLLEDVN